MEAGGADNRYSLAALRETLEKLRDAQLRVENEIARREYYARSMKTESGDKPE
jgi:hypothetical protein